MKRYFKFYLSTYPDGSLFTYHTVMLWNLTAILMISEYIKNTKDPNFPYFFFYFLIVYFFLKSLLIILVQLGCPTDYFKERKIQKKNK